MTSSERLIKSAMGLARDAAEGRLSPADLDAVAVSECRALFGVVVGPDDPLFRLQVEVARGVLVAGGIPADELVEWTAVARNRALGTEDQPAVIDASDGE